MSEDKICVVCKNTGSQCFSRCGHILHEECFKNLYSKRCQKCAKSFSTSVEVEKVFCNIASLGLDLPEVKELIIILENFEYLAQYNLVESYNGDILRRLQKHGWDINNEKFGGPDLFYHACNNDDLSKVDLLIELGLDLSKYGTKGLNEAHSSTDVFNRLIKLGIKFDHEILFKSLGNFEILQILIREGADINIKKNGCMPIHHAARLGSIKIINYLVENGADFSAKDMEGNSIVHHSCYSDYSDSRLELVKYLFENGFDFNAQNNLGETPLFIATGSYKPYIAQFLIENNVDINLCDEKGNTPLHKCVSQNRFDILKLLLEHGANVNAKNFKGVTPIHLAAGENRTKIIKELLNYGANVTETDNSGKLPLFYVVSRLCNKLNKKVVKKFIKLGADLDSQDCEGKTIREILIKRGYNFDD